MASSTTADLLAIDVKKLSFAYADEPALHDIDLAIPQGSRVLCIGANGGRSIPLHSIALSRSRADLVPRSRLHSQLESRRFCESSPESDLYLPPTPSC